MPKIKTMAIMRGTLSTPFSIQTLSISIVPFSFVIVAVVAIHAAIGAATSSIVPVGVVATLLERAPTVDAIVVVVFAVVLVVETVGVFAVVDPANASTVAVDVVAALDDTRALTAFAFSCKIDMAFGGSE